MKQNRIVQVLSVMFVGVLFSGLLCSLCLRQVDEIFIMAGTPPFYTSVQSEVDYILETVTTSDTMPADLPMAVGQLCWAFFKQSLKDSNGQYSLTTKIFGPYGTPLPGASGATEYTIEINFSNQKRGFFQYYNELLEGCGELRD